MIYKNVRLATILMLSAFIFNLKAVDQDSNNIIIETNHCMAAQIAADTIVMVAKINAEAEIEKAKIKAAADENFGLEVTKKWLPLVGAAISLFAVLRLASIFSK